MKKRFFSLFLALSLMLSGLLLPTVSAEEINWTADTIVINTAEQYKAFHDQLAAKNKFSGQTVKLGANIDLKDYTLTPLNNDCGFGGTFDGQNHSLTNVKLSGNVVAYSGALFGALAQENTATVKNLGVVNSAFSMLAYSGVFYGNVHGKVSFENVYCNVNLTNTAKGEIGGFIGRTYYAETAEISFSNCLFDGSIGNTDTSYNYSPFVGIIENAKSLSFANCLINGTFTRNKGASGEWLGAGKFICTVKTGATASISYTDCIQYNSYYQTDTAGRAAAVCPEWTAIGEGLTASKPEGFTARESGYPVPTTLVAIIDSAPAESVEPEEPEEPNEPEIDEKWKASEIVLTTADDFVQFKAVIAQNYHFVGQTVKLGADIDLTDKKLSSTDATAGNGFWGTFDGQGYAIRNLTFSYPHGYIGALFGVISQGLEKGVVIKNFKLENATISANARASVLYASVWSDLTVEDVHVDATLTGKGKNDFSGGFCGHVGYGTITMKNCSFDGSITNDGGTGAFIGKITGDTKPVSISLTDCVNNSSAPLVGKNDFVDKGFAVVITNSNQVRFADSAGKELISYDLVGGSVTVTEFPKVESSKTVVWIDLSTGAQITAPYTFTSGTSVTYKEYGRNESCVVGLQMSEAEDGKQDLRFLGGIWSTEGVGAGIEIVIQYKTADGKIQKKLFRGSSATVYDAINATENGTLKNVAAKELGVSYLFAFVVENVPTDLGQLDISVKSYKESGAKKIRIYGEEQIYHVLNGVVDATLSPLS